MKILVPPTPQKGNPRTSYPRINFPAHPDQPEDLREIAESYSKLLGMKVSVAFLIRLAIQEKIPEWRKDLKKAKNGRYHALIRSQYELI